MEQNKLTNEEIKGKPVYIYVLKDPDTLEIRYVGKTEQGIKKRLSGHIFNSRYHVGEWVKSLTKKGKIPVIEIIETSTQESWAERERYWISIYSIDCNLTNICEGGRGSTGYKMSDNQKNYLRNLHLGKKHTEESRLKMSIAGTGRIKDAKSIEKTAAACRLPVFSKNISNGNIRSHISLTQAAIDLNIKQPQISTGIKKGLSCKGFLFSYTNLFNQSEVSKRYSAPIIAIDKLGERIEFPNARKAANALNIHPSGIRSVLIGQYKQHKGYTFIKSA